MSEVECRTRIFVPQPHEFTDGVPRRQKAVSLAKRIGPQSHRMAFPHLISTVPDCLAKAHRQKTRHQKWPPETEGQNRASLVQFCTRRLSHLGEMPRYRAILSGLAILSGGDRTGWLMMQSTANQSPHPNSLLTGKLTGNFADSGLSQYFWRLAGQQIQSLAAKFPTQRNREFPDAYQGRFSEEQGVCILISGRTWIVRQTT